MQMTLAAARHRRREARGRRPLRSSAVFTLLGLGLALAACGSSSAPPSAPTGPVTAAAAPTAQAAAAVAASTAKTLALRSAFTMSFTRTSAPAASATPSGAHGLVDFTGPSGTITLELPGGPGAREQMVFLPGTVFVKPPSSSLPLQPGRPWIFANFADIAKYQVKFPPYIVQTEYVNPALTLSELAWGTTAASGYGKTVFAGVPTFHYRATVDLALALARATGPGAAVFAQTIDSEIAALGGSAFAKPVSVHIDTWSDGSGRLIGARVTPPGAGIGTVTLSLGRFGSAVDATKPARSRVVDIAAMIPGGEQEALNGGDSDGA
jgi:hypothetical protein